MTFKVVRSAQNVKVQVVGPRSGQRDAKVLKKVTIRAEQLAIFDHVLNDRHDWRRRERRAQMPQRRCASLKINARKCVLALQSACTRALAHLSHLLVVVLKQFDAVNCLLKRIILAPDFFCAALAIEML